MSETDIITDIITDILGDPACFMQPYRPEKVVEPFRTGYFDKGINDLPAIIKTAKRDLRNVEFDTLVGTGFSGAVVIPVLAHAMGKHFVLIRKENDDSHHGGGLPVGNLGQRWVFVDDFAQSGRTKRRVMTKIAEASEHRRFPTLYVGDFYYTPRPERDGSTKYFRPADLGCYPGTEL